MASIPLPALDVRPPQQQENPLDAFGKIAYLKSLANRQQLEQQQIVGAQQENQIRGLQVKDQQTLRTVAKDIDWTDPKAFDTFISKAQSGGVSPQTLSAMALQRQQYLEQVAKTDAGTLANQKTINDQLLGHIDAVKGITDPAKRAQAAQLQASQIISGNLAKNPQTLQMVQRMAAGQYVPTDEDLQGFEAGLVDHNTQIEQQLKQAQTKEAGAKTEQAQAETEKTKTETAGFAGPLAEARYRNILSNLAAHKNVPDTDLDFAKGYELSQRKTTTSSDTLGVTSSNTSQPAGLAAAMGRQAGAGGGGAQASQSNKDSLVDMLGQYKLNPSMLTRMVVKHPDVLAAVQQKYPDFDQTTYQAKAKVMQGYTSGPQSKEINAINTVAGHLDTLNDAVDALNNGNMTMLNSIAQKIGVNVTGQTPAAAFKTIIHRVGPEITTAYTPGGGGEAERFANEKDFSESLPPQTLHNNIGVTVKLLRSKIGALENQYKNTVGRDDFQQRFITPAAEQSFTKLGGENQQNTGGGHTIRIGNKRYQYKGSGDTADLKNYNPL